MSLPRSLQLGKWYVNGAGAIRVRKIRSWTQNSIFLRDRKQKNKFKRLGLHNLWLTGVNLIGLFPEKLKFQDRNFCGIFTPWWPVHQRQQIRGMKSVLYGSSVQPRSPFPFVLWMNIKVLVWGRTVLEAVAPLYSATGKMLGVQMHGLYRKKATMLYRIYINILSGKSKEKVKIFSEFQRWVWINGNVFARLKDI